MRRPLRLTTAEGTALLVALRTLGDLPGMVDTARRAAGDGEDRARRGGRGRGRRGRRGLPAGAGHHRGRARGAGGRPGAADPLLHGGPRRRHPPHRRPDAAAARRGPRLPGGVVPPGGGGAAVPARPRGRRRRARRTGRRPAGRRADGPVGGGVPGPRPSTAARCCCWSPGRAGWPSTTRWSRSWRLPAELPPEPDGAGTGHDHGHHGHGGDGRARVLLRYADPAWLVRLVLGLGGGARILEPAELAAEVARAGAALALAAGRRGSDRRERDGSGAGMTGVVGALVALAVVVALVLVLGVRPHVRRLGPQRGGAAHGHRGPARAAAGDPRRGPTSTARSPTCGGCGPPPLGATDAAPGGGRGRRLGGSESPSAGLPARTERTSEAEAMPGGWEWLIIIGVLVLLFGAKRLPEMARSVGQSARVFKGEMKGLKDDESATRPRHRHSAPQSSTRPAAPAEPAALPPVDPQVNPATGAAGRHRSRPSPPGATPTADPRSGEVPGTGPGPAASGPPPSVEPRRHDDAGRAPATSCATGSASRWSRSWSPRSSATSGSASACSARRASARSSRPRTARIPASSRAVFTADGSCTLLGTGPFDQFKLRLKVATTAGSCWPARSGSTSSGSSSPPACTRRNAATRWASSPAASVLFVAGAVLAYFVLTQGLAFLLTIGSEVQTTALTGDDYFGFLIALLIIFGVSFEFPLLVVMLNLVGVLSYAKLRGLAARADLRAVRVRRDRHARPGPVLDARAGLGAGRCCSSWPSRSPGSTTSAGPADGPPRAGTAGTPTRRRPSTPRRAPSTPARRGSTPLPRWRTRRSGRSPPGWHPRRRDRPPTTRRTRPRTPTRPPSGRPGTRAAPTPPTTPHAVSTT